ncbi:MAG: hypothetical protein SGARI_005308 [Bacillariaceae sp.]
MNNPTALPKTRLVTPSTIDLVSPSTIDLVRSMKCFSPTGFFNDGLTCYANASYHAIFNHHEVVAFLQQHGTRANPVTHQLKLLHDKYVGGNPLHRDPPVSARKVLDALNQALQQRQEAFNRQAPPDQRRAARLFLRQIPHDANEFIQSLFEIMLSESGSRGLPSVQIKTSTVCLGCQQSRKEGFGDVDCTAPPETKSYKSVKLPLHDGRNRSIQSCWDNFVKSSPTDEWVCHEGQRDARQSSARTEVDLVGSPPTLLIQLSRSPGTGAKDQRPVTISNELVAGGTKYKLISLILHDGNDIDDGHYRAAVSRHGKWYECNDQTVTAITKADSLAMTTSVYMAFYVKPYGHDNDSAICFDEE